MAKHSQDGLESRIIGKLTLKQLKAEVTKLHRSKLPYEIIAETRQISIAQY